MKKYFLTLLLIGQIICLQAQESEIIIPSNGPYLKGYPYYFHLDTMRYYLTYRNKPVYKDNYRNDLFILWGNDTGTLFIYKIKNNDTILVKKQYLYCVNPVMSIFLNGVLEGGNVKWNSEAKYSIDGRIFNIDVNLIPKLKIAEISFSKGGVIKRYLIEDQATIPKEVIDEFFLSETNILIVKPTFDIGNDIIIEHNPVVYYFSD